MHLFWGSGRLAHKIPFQKTWIFKVCAALWHEYIPFSQLCMLHITEFLFWGNLSRGQCSTLQNTGNVLYNKQVDKSLCNKTKWTRQLHKFILSWNSTCFGQFVCPSSRVYSLYTQQWFMSYRFVDRFRAGPGLVLVILYSWLSGKHEHMQPLASETCGAYLLLLINTILPKLHLVGLLCVIF